MNPLVAHIVCGQAFFSGAILVVGGLQMSVAGPGRAIVRFRWIMFTFGILLVAVSSTPVPTILVVPLVAATIIALRSTDDRKKQQKVISAISILLWLIAVAHEAAWQIQEPLRSNLISNALPVLILADSITAGLGENEAVTWPVLLAGNYPELVLDLSHVGETVSSATDRALRHEIPAQCIVIIELGGNDLLGSTSHEQFERDLETLLKQVCVSGRMVVMFELPLPPFHNSWGATQRKLASKYSVNLIPKRVLTSVLEVRQATLDSIHLSQEGHNRIQSIIQRILQI